MMLPGFQLLPQAQTSLQEPVVDARALLRVRHLGMELQRVEVAGFVGHAGDGHVAGGGDELESGRHGGDAIAVAHPHVEQAVAFGVLAILDVEQQIGVAAGADLGIAELMHGAGLDLAAELLRHGLHAVADAQHGDVQIPHGLRRGGRIGLQHRLGATGKDDALGREGADVGVADIPGMDLAVDAQLAHAARDELRVLGAEVEDQDAVGVDVVLRCGHWIRARIGHLCGSRAGVVGPNMTANSCQEGSFMSVVYSLYDALVSINVPDEKAKAVIDAMEREMMDKLATKADLEHVRVASTDIGTARRQTGDATSRPSNCREDASVQGLRAACPTTDGHAWT